MASGRIAASCALLVMFALQTSADSWSASYGVPDRDETGAAPVLRQASDGGFYLLSPALPPGPTVRKASASRRGAVGPLMNHLRCDAWLSPPRTFNVTRTDPSGALRWSYGFQFAACTSGNDLAAAPDGGAFVLGSVEGPIPYPDLTTPIVIKLDGEGTIVWQTKLTRSPLVQELVPRSIKATSDGGALVSLGAFVVKLNSSGEIELDHHFLNQGIGDIIVNDVLPTPDGYYAVGTACVYSGSFCNSFQAFAARIGNPGTIEWARTFAGSSGFQSIQQATLSSVYAEALRDGGSQKLYHLNGDGEVRWAMAMSFTSQPDYAPGGVDPAGRIWYGEGAEGEDARVRVIAVDGTVAESLVGTPDWSERAGIMTGTTQGVAIMDGSDPGLRVMNLDLSTPGCLTMTPVPVPPDSVIPLGVTGQPLSFGIVAGAMTAEPLSLIRNCLPTTLRRECGGTSILGRFQPRVETASCGVQLDFEFAQPQKVLLHKYRNDDEYPSEYQRRVVPGGTIASPDRHIEVRVRVTSSGVPVPDRPVYFRVSDPPDSAPYTVAAGDARLDDNADPNPKGELLTLEPCAGAPPPGVSCAVSAPDGYARVILRTSEHIAGENYFVQGSLDKDFTCAPACPQSGRIETWKRVYLEVGRMFKKGSYVRSSSSGGNAIEVLDRTAFKVGDRVALLHGPVAPRMGPSSPSEYSVIERTIVEVGARIGTVGVLELDEPATEMLGVDGRRLFPSLIADFVGVITGDPARDYYEASTIYVQTLFSDAFVDYVVMDPVPLPLVESLTERIDAQLPIQDETHRYVERWFRHLGHNNHQLMIGLRETSSVNVNARGITRAVGGFSYSHVMVRHVLGVLSTAASRRLLGEVTAHEVAHQWHTNRWSSHTTNLSHCDSFKYYDDSSKMCLMHYTYEAAGSTRPEFHDDIVRFHYVKGTAGVDSEYRWIRERCDPVPTDGVSPGSLDWWSSPAALCR